MQYLEAEEMIEKLRELLRQAEAGELQGPVAIRVFHKDGTHEDVAFGGTVEQQERAIAALQANFEKKH